MAHLSKLLCVLVACVLAACSSASKTDPCEEANLSETAKVTGLAGRPLASNPRAEKCLGSANTGKVQKLHEGYESGLDLFCSEERAAKRGAEGMELGDLSQCGPERSDRARLAYDRGVRIYCKPSNGFVIGTMGVPSRSCEEQEWQDEFKKGQSVLMESKELDSSDKVSL